jgi:DNA-binding CsgD family transcriptional regulator
MNKQDKQPTHMGATAWMVEEGMRLRAARAHPHDWLTLRERQVLPLIAQGLSDKEIAHQLGISPRTVQQHVAHILAKLDMPNRAGAAVYFVRHLQIVPVDTPPIDDPNGR